MARRRRRRRRGGGCLRTGVNLVLIGGALYSGYLISQIDFDKPIFDQIAAILPYNPKEQSDDNQAIPIFPESFMNGTLIPGPTQPVALTPTPDALMLTPTPTLFFTQTSKSVDEIAQMALNDASQYIGVPYKNFGFIDDNGSFVYWTGGAPTIDNVIGFNCAGYQLQAARAISRVNIKLDDAFQQRTDRPADDEVLRQAYGWDQTLNIAYIIDPNSQIFKPIDGFTEFQGYDPDKWDDIGNHMEIGKMYLWTLNHDKGGIREYSHVGIAIPTNNGVTVIHSTAAGGVQSTSLENLSSLYPDYKGVFVEVDISQPDQGSGQVAIATPTGVLNPTLTNTPLVPTPTVVVAQAPTYEFGLVSFNNCRQEIPVWAEELVTRVGPYVLFNDPLIVTCSDTGVTSFQNTTDSGVVSYNEIIMKNRDTVSQEIFTKVFAHELGHMWHVRYMINVLNFQEPLNYDTSLDQLAWLTNNLMSCQAVEGFPFDSFRCYEAVANAVKDFMLSTSITGAVKSPFKTPEYGCVGEGITDSPVECSAAYYVVRDRIFEGNEFYEEIIP